MKPRVFIGIPTYNRPRYVRETVESLRAQTLVDWRAIVSDNASQPAATAEVRTFIEGLGDKRISFHLQPRNGGEYGQGRFFLEAAGDEDYFVILHDDDLLGPDYLATAVGVLDQKPDLAYYHCTPSVIDGDSQLSPSLTRWYHEYHGHTGVPEGEIVVLDRVLGTGFTPICGTCFRHRYIRETGLVDSDLSGNYPFELNVLLRVGERGLRAWYSPTPRVAFRMHETQMRLADRVYQNPAQVGAAIKLLAKRKFSGRNERRRREILGRMHRAQALIDLSARRFDAAQTEIREALRLNWRSKHTLVAATGILMAPAFAVRWVPAPQNISCPPSLAQIRVSPEASTDPR